MIFKNDATGVIDLDTFGAIEDDSGLESGTGLGSVDGSDVINKGPTNNQPLQSGGRWHELVHWWTRLVKLAQNGQVESLELWTDWWMPRLWSYAI